MEIKKDGEIKTQSSGFMKEQAGKPRFELLFPEGVPYNETFLYRIAQHYTGGAEKYESRNWEKACTQEDLELCKQSAARHFMQWMCGENDEDHAAAVFFHIHAVENIKRKLNKEKNDE